MTIFELLQKDLFRIKREAEALKLLRHKNIAQLLQFVETPQYIYFVMEVSAL